VRRPIAIAVSLVCTFAALRARASEPDLFGMGARSSAMAGTGAADAEGYDAAYSNPAGLIGPTRRRLTLGYVGARYNLQLDGEHRGVADTNGLILGAAVPLPFGGVMKDRLALGLGFYFPAGVINRARDGFPDEKRLSLLDNRTQVVSILVAAAAKLHARVSLGVGVLALAALIGEIAIRVDAGGRFTTVSEEQLIASFAPIIGLRVRATRWLKLGLTFRGESRSGYDIAIKSSLGNALPIQVPTFHVAGTAQFDPLQMQIEGAFRPLHWLNLVAGLTWKHWSAYPIPVQNATLGAPPQPTPDFHDTAVPRVAGEFIGVWGKVTLCARLGYLFEWSPAPQDAGRVYLDADRHVLTAGGGLEYHGRLVTFQIDAFAQYHHLDGTPRATGDFGTFGGTFGVDL